MAAKKFWIKRANLPLDKNKRKIVTTTLRWKEEDKSRMIAGSFCQMEKHINIGPDDVIEGDHFEQFVKEGILEPYTEAKAEKDVKAMAEAAKPVVPITTAPPAAAPAVEPVSTAPKAAPEAAPKAAAKKDEDEAEPEDEKKDRGKKAAKKSKGK